MSQGDQLYSFAFKGILASSAMDDLHVTQKEHFSEEALKKIYKSLSIEDLDQEFVSSAEKMAIVFISISTFENTVRRFIFKKLIETKGDDWWTACVSEKIRDKAESRKREESKIRWHAPRGDMMLNYTEFGDLISIMRQNLSHFEPHISSLEWAENIVKTVERSRNVIMHSGELGAYDIERVGMCIRDWVNQVG